MQIRLSYIITVNRRANSSCLVWLLVRGWSIERSLTQHTNNWEVMVGIVIASHVPFHLWEGEGLQCAAGNLSSHFFFNNHLAVN